MVSGVRGLFAVNAADSQGPTARVAGGGGLSASTIHNFEARSRGWVPELNLNAGTGRIRRRFHRVPAAREHRRATRRVGAAACGARHCATGCERLHSIAGTPEHSRKTKRSIKAERDSRLVKWSLGGVWARLWRSEMALMLSDVSPFLRFGAAGPLSKPPFLARQGRSDQISRLSVSSDPDTPIAPEMAPQRADDRRPRASNRPEDRRPSFRPLAERQDLCHHRRERTMAPQRTFDGPSTSALGPLRELVGVNENERSQREPRIGCGAEGGRWIERPQTSSLLLLTHELI